MRVRRKDTAKRKTQKSQRASTRGEGKRNGGDGGGEGGEARENDRVLERLIGGCGVMI